MGAGGVDEVDLAVGRSPHPDAGFGLSNLPAAVRFLVVVAANVGSEVAEPGLAGRTALIGAQIGNRVIDVDGAADRAA